ncbi:MAG: type VII secretion protein EccE [Actinomycetota bacterium]|nr:type VII secretion protein EccE [Actinomycetota bacterium]
MTRPRLSYRFGPLERRGLFGAIRGGQAVVIVLGALVGIVVLDSAPSATGALLATFVFGGACAAMLVPVGRRGADEWVPLMLAFAGRVLSGRRRFRSAVPGRGMRTRLLGAGTAHERPEASPEAPPALRAVRIQTLAYRERDIGVLSERSGRKLTAVLACRVGAFSLLDPESQERRLARWGLVLAGAAGTAVRRIGWIERTAPAQGDELARWLHAEREPAVPLRGTPMIESYLELIGTTAKVTQEHEILVAVQVDARRVRERGTDTVGRALVEATERVAQGLEAAEVRVLGALTAGQLARALRTAFDPFAGSELATLDAVDPHRGELAEASAWPLGAQESWDHLRSDGALHATYWIAGWPRVDVSPMFMDALLGRSSAVRSVAVTFEPIPPDRSTREVEAAVTRDRADRDLRHRFGQSETARQRQAQEATARRESELAAGHCEVRLAGFVTVSGRDQDELRRAGAEVLEHAARARLELHRMYGQQAEAFTFTLPLCRGLR